MSRSAAIISLRSSLSLSLAVGKRRQSACDERDLVQEEAEIHDLCSCDWQTNSLSLSADPVSGQFKLTGSPPKPDIPFAGALIEVLLRWFSRWRCDLSRRVTRRFVRGDAAQRRGNRPVRRRHTCPLN